MSRVMTLTRRRPQASGLAAALVLLLGVLVPVQLGVVASYAAPVVTVNSTGDASDATPGDEVCDTGGTTTGGDPECTLRAALQEANAAAAVTTIVFDVPDTDAGWVDGIVTIAPAAALPTITAPVVIDGSTQPGSAGDPIVAIDGSAWATSLLHVTGGGTTVQSLVLHSAGEAAIHLEGSGGNTISDTWIGVLPDGSTAAGSAAEGVRIQDVPSTWVTGTTIAHSGGAGIAVTGSSDDVAILANRLLHNTGLGIDLGDDGVTANDPGDTDTGPNGLLNTPEPTAATPTEVTFDLDVQAGDHRIEVFRNPTAGAHPSGSGEGEELVGAATVTHAGAGPQSFTVAVAGVSHDDELTLTATEDLGGGTYGATSEFSAAITADGHLAVVNDAGNAPDANPGDGICDTGGLNADGDPACTLRAALQEANASAALDTVWFDVPAADARNVAGTVTISPAAALPSITAPVTIDATTQPGFSADPVVALDGTDVTGSLLTLAADDTLVRSLSLHSGGHHGLEVTGDDVTVIGTWVGLLPDGTTAAGMAGDGVRVDGSVRVLLSGGTVVGSGGNGVTVVGAAADDVAIVDTTIRDSDGLGIDLGDDGVTPNDPGDTDTGPNGLYNRPVVTAVSESGGTVTFEVELDVAAGNVLLQVFTTPLPHPSGAGEGDELVHTATLSHPGGVETHAVSFPGDLGSTFTATATKALGGGSYGATSEFSDTATRPVPADDAYQVDSGVELVVPADTGVLANDHDADGDALTATLAGGPSDAAAFSFQPDGSFSYTSTAGLVGTDSFTYTVSDGVFTSEPATVTVTVLPVRGERVITDSTGNGHHGTPRGGMTSADAVDGRIGGALDFDGSGDRITINNLDVAGQALTLSAWVNPDTIGTDPIVLAKALGLGDAGVEWRVLLADTSATTANAVGSVRTGAGLANSVDPTATDVGDGWVHLVVRYDGAQVVLFVDGVAVASAAHSGSLRPDPSVPVSIGGAPGGGQSFDGRIDEVRVSAVARSDAWIAATHATQAGPGAAVRVGAIQTSAPGGWTTSTDQSRSGGASALAPSGVLRSWLTLDGITEGGLEAVAWWRVNTLTDLDLGQGVRAGDAAGTGPLRQDETGLFGGSGWDLGQVDGGRTQLVPPPAGQTPAIDTWQRVVLRIDQADALSATAAGADVPATGTTPAGVAPAGSFGLRVGMLDPTTRWWIDDVRLRRYVTPEPVATLRRTELAP